MQDLDRTTRVGYGRDSSPAFSAPASMITVFDGNAEPRAIRLDSLGKDRITFGHSNYNDIVLSSPLVSREHGRFSFWNGQWIIEDKAVYGDKPSTNGLIYNDASIVSRPLSDGDFIRIDDGVETIAEGVLFVFSSAESENKWQTLRFTGKPEISIGRDIGCDVVLPHISVSKFHARIVFEQGRYYILDNGSTNGVIVNNKRVFGKQLLHEKDVIVITNSKLIFTSAALHYCCYKSGISVDAENVVITRGKGRKKFVTGDNVSLNIKPGELIAIIGGSGAGKSTILNCMCGYLQPEKGEVYINGTDLYGNFDSLKKLIGYVPQSDIVYDNLTLYDMLSYTAKLRLPKDTSEQEREAAINKAIGLVELTEKKNSFIKAMSGGQKKRASIAVELLSDPNLLFLDEPASGLDPGTERSLMLSLRAMADAGKTVILVTHSTLQLKVCDKIVFMGRGGKLCFFGSHDEALEFFGVEDVVDIYTMINDRADFWRGKYDASTPPKVTARRTLPTGLATNTADKRAQLPVLCSRYVKLIVNDRQRLILLLAQAPLLALLIGIVAKTDQTAYVYMNMTKSLLFALSCAAFWVGMLNSIQEVCKERTILKREYMTGLSLNSYLASKVVVLGFLCLIQSLMIMIVFAIMVKVPNDSFGAFLEMFITTFLTALAATATGLFVSSLFSNADRAMTVAPILLMPQMLFSGILFTLEEGSFLDIVSYITACRWSMSAYGATAELNDLPAKAPESLQKVYMIREIPPTFNRLYEDGAGRMILNWLALLITAALFIGLARLVLGMTSKEKN